MDKIIYVATERQAAFHAAPEMFKLYGGAMGGGKTYALCAEGIALSISWPGNRGYICRHELKSFKRTTLLVLNDMLERSGLISNHHQTDNYYLLRNGSTIYYGGLGDDVSAIEKLKSMELGWYAIDEASETSEKFFLMLASRLRLKLPGIRYFGLLASNPDPGWLKYRFIDKKQAEHIFVPALPRDNPHLPPDYVARLQSVFPEEWQKRFIEGDWGAFEGTNNVFPYAAIRDALVSEAKASPPKEIGVDVARYGDDESIIAYREGAQFSILEVIRKSDLMSLTGRIVHHIKAKNPDATKIDADGMGAGVVDRLREQKYPVIEVHAGAKAKNSERFANQKAEIYWGFRERLLAGDVVLPDDLELQAQLTSCTYRIKSSGQIEITPKDEMKKQGLKSPDRAEGIIYAAANLSPGAYFGFTKHEVY